MTSGRFGAGKYPSCTQEVKCSWMMHTLLPSGATQL